MSWPDGFRGDMPLAAARAALMNRLDEGLVCPCCTQRARLYRRPLTAVAARAVVALYRDHGRDFAHLPTVAARRLPDVSHQGGYLVLAAHWGLIEDERTALESGGRPGWWRVTPLGESFVHGRATVRQYARIFNGQCLGLTGERITVSDALGEPFDLNALLATPAPKRVADDSGALFEPPPAKPRGAYEEAA